MYLFYLIIYKNSIEKKQFCTTMKWGGDLNVCYRELYVVVM